MVEEIKSNTGRIKNKVRHGGGPRLDSLEPWDEFEARIVNNARWAAIEVNMLAFMLMMGAFGLTLMVFVL